MATTEQSIADLASASEALLQLPQQITDVSLAQIVNIGEAYQERMGSLSYLAFVDQANGDDAAAGTQAAPFKSIQKAVENTPFGGICEVRLAADYHMDVNVDIDGRRVMVTSDSTLRHNLTFERYSYEVGATTYRSLRAFRLLHGATIHIRGLSLSIPELDGTWGQFSPSATSAIISVPSIPLGAFSSVVFSNNNIAISPTPFDAMIRHFDNMSLYWVANTVTDQDFKGRLFTSPTDLAGTDVVSLPWLVSNLAQV